MEKNQYKLCLEVLRRFADHKLLSEFILIGSWCVVFYEKFFPNPDFLKRITLITRDIDFLVDRPSSIKTKVDIPELLKDLGFITTFKGQQGYIKLDHPDLILEFLTPQRGRGRDAPYPLPGLSINATALRFLNFLSENTVKVTIENFTVLLPHPVNFGLHKLIISPRRAKKEKEIKDRETAVIVLKTLIENKQEREIVKIFRSTPKKWQAYILATLQDIDEQEILNILKSS